MMSTVMCLVALSHAPAQSGQLNVTNVRTTYGSLGPARPDNKILPGDLVCLSFDIEGFQANADGKVLYGIGLQVTDPKSEVVFSKAPSNLELPTSSGGKPVPACAKVEVGLDQPPGKYELKVTVSDRVAGTSKWITRTYEILPIEFGLVRLSLTSDREGKISAPVFSKGRQGWVNFTAVGFGRDSAKGQPFLTASLRVLDGNGKSVLPKPSSGTINQDVPAKVGAVPMQFALVLLETGRFTVELKATDEISGHKTTVSFPMQVVDSK